MKKSLQYRQCKSLWLVFIAELIVLSAILIIFFIPSKKYVIHQGESIKLPYGHYYVTCDYKIKDDTGIANFVYIQKPDGSVDGIVQGEDYLSSDANSYKTEFWITGLKKEIQISVRQIDDINESQAVEIEKYIIESTKYAYVILFFIVLFIAALTLTGIFLKSKVLTLSKYDIEKICIFMFVLLISCIPLFNKNLLVGWDIEIHLVRIEGIMQGFKAGQFPVRVEPAFNGGYGYAFSTYYGGLFYNIAAIARLIGFSIQNAYKIYVVFINIATMLISYYCFKIMFENDKTALYGSILYTLSLYRIFDLYQRGAVGEYTAITFLPLVAAGLWKIYTCAIDDADYKRLWILPVFGYTGIIQSHILSTEIAGIFTILACLVLFKRTFRKKTFVVLLKIVIYTIILNLWFLYPFFENYLFEDTIISENLLQPDTLSNDITLFGMFKYNFGRPKSWYTVLEAGVGPTLAIVLFMVIYAFFGKVLRKNDKKMLIFTAVFAGISIIISTNIFPWNGIIKKLNTENIDSNVISTIASLLRNCIINIQYAFRFMIISILFITITVCILHVKRDRVIKYAGYAMLAFVIVQTIYSGISFLINGRYEKYLGINDNNVGFSTSIGNMEYIPLTAEGEMPFLEQFYNMHYCYTTNAKVTNYTKQYTNINAHIIADKESTGIIEFPLLYYRGYKVVDVNTGQEFKTFKIGKCSRLGIITESGYEGDIKVYYAGKMMWHVMDVVSFVAFVILISYIIVLKKSSKSKFFA